VSGNRIDVPPRRGVLTIRLAPGETAEVRYNRDVQPLQGSGSIAERAGRAFPPR